MNQVCQICNTSVSNLGNHVRHLHVRKNDIESLEKYYELYISKNITKSCIVCGNLTKFRSFSLGWSKTCSHKCAVNDPDVANRRLENTKKGFTKKYGEGIVNASQVQGHRDKVKATNLKLHGVENWVNTDKAKSTNLERYGCISYTGTDLYNKKYKETCLEKYGVDHHTRSDEHKQNKIKATLEKYGVEHTLQIPEIRDRIEATNLEKYGGTLNGSKILKERIKNTMISRYGVVSPIQNEEIKSKILATRLEKYGTTNNFKRYANSLGYDNVNLILEIQAKMKKSRLKTLWERYKVTNISQIPEIQSKIRISVYNTNMKRYGVSCTLQSKDIINPNTHAVHTYPNSNITYQSKLEYRFIERCIENNIGIENGDIIMYTNLSLNKIQNYYVDFKITYPDGTKQLIEMKGKHRWYYRDLENNTLKSKVNAAQKFSLENGYRTFKVVFDINKFFKSIINVI